VDFFESDLRSLAIDILKISSRKLVPMSGSNSELSATGIWPATASTDAAVAVLPTVPGYELLDELGRGGMGVVYRAKQLSTDRIVALKLIRDGALAGPHERARFRVEAEAAARVRHPNVVEVLDVGEHNGLPYFAMELIEGGTLDDVIAGQPLPYRIAAELLQTLALAVQFAHEQNIVHRDLKPSNILFQVSSFKVSSLEDVKLETLKLGTIKVADFGLAKRLDTDSTALTGTGAVLGTVGYMAPEQAAGRTHEIGPATDIYALGAILYEILTGRPPFDGDSRDKAIANVLQTDPIPPTRFDSAIPRDLETICLKCLEKRPDQRYRSAADLAGDLGQFLAGAPVSAVAIDERERLNRIAARDGYTILGEIGRGPQSKVYRATHGPMNQPVAVKVFHAGTCTREAWDARMQRGAEVRAGLAHPQYVNVRAAGWWDDRPFVVTDYLPQGPLAVRPDGKLMPIAQALYLVEQMGEVIVYLHRQGVIHGNLKPSNVLLAGDGIPRIVDPHVTSGLFLNSSCNDPALAYLAPELFADPDAEPRQNTDVYGLGLILYELLTGQPAFSGTDLDEIREQVLSREPVPPTQWNAKVHPVLESVCLRCLRKNPWKRFSRAYDVVKRLRHFQTDPDYVG
jgi:serine/threonine protein kinase